MKRIRTTITALAASLAAAACSATVSTMDTTPNLSRTGADAGTVWVCHGRNAHWIEVAPAAVDAHRRHGDRVTSTPQETGEACTQ